jgi:hypothetical protein
MLTMDPQQLLVSLWNTRAGFGLARSALPDAPTVPEKDARPALTGARLHLASALRRAAARVEPAPQHC